MTKDAALKLGLQLVATAEYLATDAEICGKDAKEERALIQRSKIAFEEALAQEQEPVAMRYDYDGYGWLYIDNGSGSNWREKIKNAEPLYTAPPQPKPEQEPVEWGGDCVLGHCGSPAGCEDSNCCRANYTAPPQRTWVGLTDEERDHLEGLHLYAARNQVEAWIEGVPAFIDAIEAKLREKNGG